MPRCFAAFAVLLLPVAGLSPTALSAANSDYAGEHRLLNASKLFPKPRMDVAPIATLPAGSKVVLSGKQESVLAEATDSKGRKGWVSIQDIAW